MKYPIKFFLFIGLVSLLLISACINEDKKPLVPLNKTITCNKPYILVSGNCCLDINDNGICDVEEIVTTTTVGSITTTLPEETCYDGIQNQNETGIDCGGSCKPCPSVCDNLINDTVTRPAARTTTLCLSNKSYVSFSGLHFKVKDFEKDKVTLTIYDYDNGTYKEREISNRSDLLIGNISLRLIGRVEENSTLYSQIYAWIIRGEIICSMNSDCGEEKFIGYDCLENMVIRQFLHYRCVNPGTVLSKCEISQGYNTYEKCGTKGRCTLGDNKCFPKECFDGIQNQDEEHIDCGGSCRPCHCFNNTQDADEKGIDCDGSCKPCVTLIGDTIPPVITIASPINTIYTKQIIDLNYNTSELTDWCGYSLNGRANITLDGNGSIYARKGLNELILYCNDTTGNMNSVKLKFTVFLIQNQICPDDSVSTAYSDYFDNVIFYEDDENQLGVPDRCTENTFEYSLSFMNDSEVHKGRFNSTYLMMDSIFSLSENSVIKYECRETGKIKINYAKIQKNSNPQELSIVKMIIYFYERKPIGKTNTFWRIYPYNTEGNSVNFDEYIDIPYDPIESRCDEEVKSLYQELDLSPLLRKLKGHILDFRIGFYTNKIDSEIRIMEIELYTEHIEH